MSTDPGQNGFDFDNDTIPTQEDKDSIDDRAIQATQWDSDNDEPSEKSESDFEP